MKFNILKNYNLLTLLLIVGSLVYILFNGLHFNAKYLSEIIIAILILYFGIEQKLNLPASKIIPLMVITMGYKVSGKWKIGDIKFGHAGDQSLFYNGIICIRVMMPFFIGGGFRWSGSNPIAREFLHWVIGWKLNGELAAEFRIQSDQSSSAGATTPNYGQSYGWDKGTK